MLKGKRKLITLLMATTGTILIAGAGNAEQNNRTIEARIEIAREQLLATVKENDNEQTQEQEKDQIAQWYNWPDWNNWNDQWRNW